MSSYEALEDHRTGEQIKYTTENFGTSSRPASSWR